MPPQREDLSNFQLGGTGQALGNPTDRLLQLFQPGGPVDVWGRLLTPGVKSVTPSPQDDPFYARHIQSAINPAPATPQLPGAGYAQQMAGQFGDTGTAASTVGVKEQKAQKIKKVKK